MMFVMGIFFVQFGMFRYVRSNLESFTDEISTNDNNQEMNNGLNYYGFTEIGADIQISQIRKMYKTTKYNLIYSNSIIQSIRDVTMDDKYWWKHREVCFGVIDEARYPIIDLIQSKIDTYKELKSQRFIQFTETLGYNISIQDLPLMHPYIQINETEWNNDNIRNQKYEYFVNHVYNQLVDDDYFFVIKPSHLIRSIGVEMYNRDKWEKLNMTKDKLWHKINDV